MEGRYRKPPPMPAFSNPAFAGMTAVMHKVSPDGCAYVLSGARIGWKGGLPMGVKTSAH